MTAARLVLLLLVLLSPGRALGEGEPAGDFDFYVLALSWSPSYCAATAPGRSPLQCDSGRSYGFILHGLWPQYERGYPSDCPTHEPGPSRALVRSLLDIMPSEGLVQHQWRKHGRCSGLTAEAYFALSREAFDRVRLPSLFDAPTGSRVLSTRDIEAAFLAANPEITEEGVSLVCRDGRLQEVRVCLDRDLKARDCTGLERRDCRRRALEIPPTR